MQLTELTGQIESSLAASVPVSAVFRRQISSADRPGPPFAPCVLLYLLCCGFAWRLNHLAYVNDFGDMNAVNKQNVADSSYQERCASSLRRTRVRRKPACLHQQKAQDNPIRRSRTVYCCVLQDSI